MANGIPLEDEGHNQNHEEQDGNEDEEEVLQGKEDHLI